MDINNYSYTGPDFGVDNVRTVADITELDGRGYLRLSLEQWGTDRDNLNYVLSGFWNGEDIDATISADNSEGWLTLRNSYEIAARLYNALVNDDECIPLF